MMDGSTDISGGEQEAVYVRLCIKGENFWYIEYLFNSRGESTALFGEIIPIFQWYRE